MNVFQPEPSEVMLLELESLESSGSTTATGVLQNIVWLSLAVLTVSSRKGTFASV